MIQRHLFATLALFSCINPAIAEIYPARPITLIVPFAAGGPADVLARALAEPMGAALGQSIIVENVAGAGGSIGVGRAVHAAPDGYTLSVGNWSTHVLNGAIYPLTYDLLNDFEPIARLPSSPQLIVAKNAVPAKDLGDLVKWLKSSKATVGTAGIGSASHVSGLFFESRIGAQFAFVPYRGGGQALQDVVAGHIDLMLDQVSNSLPQVQAGAVKVYAVTANKRLPSAPDIPTVDEVGLPEFYISVWYGLWAPKGTPPEVVGALNTAAVNAMISPALRTHFADLGQELPDPDRRSAFALGAFQKSEIEKWWPILRNAKVKPQ